jgi:hypothetical protein
MKPVAPVMKYVTRPTIAFCAQSEIERCPNQSSSPSADPPSDVR